MAPAQGTKDTKSLSRKSNITGKLTSEEPLSYDKGEMYNSSKTRVGPTSGHSDTLVPSKSLGSGRGDTLVSDGSLQIDPKPVDQAKEQEELYFENLKEQTQSAIRYIHDHGKVFQELGYNIKKIDKMHLEINSLKEAISREPSNTEYQNLFQDNFRAIVEMADDLKDFLSIDYDLEARKDTERKERIEKLLEKLPRNNGDRPTLSNLSSKQWWTLFNDAQQTNDPELFYERQDPGYRQGMIEFFNRVLIPAQNREQKYMSYNDYTEMHKIATEFLPNDKRDQMRWRGGIDELTTAYTRYNITPAKNTEILYERFKSFQEMRNEHINDLPLFQNWQSEEEEYIEEVVHSIRQSSPRAITIGWVRHDYKPTAIDPSDQFYAAELGSTIMIPSYLKDEGPRHVDSVLKLYYQGRETPGQTEYQRLRAIAETIRKLHVMHPKYDGNSRTNIFGLMNKWLIEEGFSPTILPNGKGVFYGVKTLDGLVEDMVIGMHSFMREVKQNKENTVSAIETTH